MSRDWEENAYEGKHDRMGKATLSHISFGTSVLEEPSLKFWYTQFACSTLQKIKTYYMDQHEI